jgi:hypothetical protein
MIAVQRARTAGGRRDAGTGQRGLKVGSKVTIKYRMVATTVDVKPATETKRRRKEPPASRIPVP